jgi:hypothetical protein
MDVGDDDEVADNQHANYRYTICLEKDGTIVNDVTAMVGFVSFRKGYLYAHSRTIRKTAT